MNKKVYVLTDGTDEIFDARFMDQAEYEAEQQKANEATDGTFGWINAQSYYAAAAGSATSERKAQTSRENGKLGGRPRMTEAEMYRADFIADREHDEEGPIDDGNG